MVNEELALLNKSNLAIEFFRSNLSSITNDYNNEFVAINEKGIIDTGKTMGEVITKLNKKGEDTSKLLIKFVSKNKFIL